MQVCLTMKIETESMISYENRNCSYAKLQKLKLQVCLTIKIETTSMLNYEKRNCKYAHL